MLARRWEKTCFRAGGLPRSVPTRIWSKLSGLNGRTHFGIPSSQLRYRQRPGSSRWSPVHSEEPVWVTWWGFRHGPCFHGAIWQGRYRGPLPTNCHRFLGCTCVECRKSIPPTQKAVRVTVEDDPAAAEQSYQADGLYLAMCAALEAAGFRREALEQFNAGVCVAKSRHHSGTGSIVTFSGRKWPPFRESKDHFQEAGTWRGCMFLFELIRWGVSESPPHRLFYIVDLEAHHFWQNSSEMPQDPRKQKQFIVKQRRTTCPVGSMYGIRYIYL